MNTNLKADPAHRIGGSAKLPAEARAPRHGIFTGVAYATAWITATFGTVAGVLGAIANMENGGPAIFTAYAVGLVLAAWISAAGIGVLAEISRKLTPRNGGAE